MPSQDRYVETWQVIVEGQEAGLRREHADRGMTVERLRENIKIFDFTLSAAEMEPLEGIDRGERIGADPDTFARP